MSDVRIEIDADTTLANKNLEKLTEHGADLAKELGDHFLELGSLVAAAFAGFTLEKFVEQSLEADSAITALKASLKLNGELAEGNVEKFEDLAKSIAQTTGVSAEAVLAQITYVKALGGTDEQTQKIITTAKELSAALGQDLGTSVNQLVQSFEGTVPRGLGRVVSGLKTLSEEQLRSGAGVDLIAAKFSGFTESLGGSTTVKIAVAKENFRLLGVAIGDTITQSDAFQDSITLLSDTFKTLTEFVENLDFNEMIEGITRLGAQALLLFAILRAGSIAQFFQSIKIGAVEAAESFALSSFKIIGSLNLTEIAAFSAKVGMQLFYAAATLGASLLIDQLVKAALEVDNVGDFFSVLGFRAEKVLLFITDLTVAFFQLLFEGLAKIPGLGDSLKGVLKDFEAARASIAASQKGIQGNIDGLTTSGKAASRALAEAGDATDDLSGRATGLGQNSAKAFQELQRRIESLTKALRFADSSGVDKINAEENEKLAIFKRGLDARLVSRQAYEDAVERIEKERIRRVSDEEKKTLSASGITNPLAQSVFSNLGGFNKNSDPSKLDDNQKQAAGITEAITKGAAGAQPLVAQAFAATASALTGLPPQITGPVFDLLTKSSEEVKKTINGFIDAVPQLIVQIAKNVPVIIQALVSAIPRVVSALIAGIPDFIEALITSVPTLIETLVEDLPELIQAIVDGIPRVIDRLVQDIPQIINRFIAEIPRLIQEFSKSFAAAMPQIAISFNEALIKEAPRFISELIKAIPGALASGAQASISAPLGALQGLGGLLGFAEGGLVPKGHPNDSMVARLTSDELVVDNSMTKKLGKFLDNLDSGRGDAGAGGGSHTVVLQLGEQQLASVILDLNKRGFRMA